MNNQASHRFQLKHFFTGSTSAFFQKMLFILVCFSSFTASSQTEPIPKAKEKDVISGSITDSHNGSAIQNALITLTYKDNSPTTSVFSKPDGSFTIHDPSGKVVSLTVSGTYYSTAVIKLSKNKRRNLEIVLEEKVIVSGGCLETEDHQRELQRTAVPPQWKNTPEK